MSKPISFPGQGSFVVRRTNGSKKNFSNIVGGPLTSLPTDGGGGGGGADDGGIVTNPPALAIMPVFPDFAAMGCKELGVAIEQLKQTMNAPSLVANPPEWTAAYVAAINNATALYNSKGCATSPDGPPVNVTVNNNPPVITSSGVPGASAGFPSGGGGGGAASPAATKTKKDFPWLWVIIGGVALYLFTTKK